MVMKINALKFGCCLWLWGVIIGMNACSYEDIQLRTEENESSYDRIGQLHNEGLDYVLDKMKTALLLTKSDKKRIPGITEIRRMCVEFAESKGYTVMTRSYAGIREDVGDFSFLSVQQQDYLLQAKTIVQKASPEDFQELIRKMKTLEENLLRDNKMDVQQKEVLLYVMAVCRYSASYWAVNYEKWHVELYGLNTVNTLKTRSENKVWVSKEWWEHYKSIVWADGVGGIYCGNGYELSDATVASVAEYLDARL